jgi:glycosyltransferase involved in cell wall biosynthesis
MKIVFWQNIISPLQSYLIRNIAYEHDVLLVVEEVVSESRIKQGWSVPDTGNATVIVLKDNRTLLNTIEQTKGSIHVFSGFSSYPKIRVAFEKIYRTETIGIIAESAIQMGWKCSIRKLLYRFYCIKYSNHISFIFAMGNIGVDWYVNAGFKKENVFQFQYFTELPEINFKRLEPNTTLRFIFIGQLVKRKGIDNLLKALAPFSGDKSWHLSIVGDGVMKQELLDYTRLNALEYNIDFLGNLNNKDAMDLLAYSADYLILPSRFDGWGAVLNEALSRGVPVIVSNKCGGAAMIQDPSFGWIYNEDKFEELTLILRNVITNNIRFSSQERLALSTKFKAYFTESKVNDFITILKSIDGGR